MKAHIITIGNEILIGDIVNTNASWLGQHLTEAGFDVQKVISVGDKAEDILDAFKDSEQNADLVIVTGGLGPTHDDITKKTFQTYFNVDVRRDDEVLLFVRSFFEKRGIPFSESNVMQADVLENCEVLFNHWGTAPGMWISGKTCSWAILPGVPSEMKNLFSKAVLPKINQYFPEYRYFIKSTYLSVAGIGESTLADTKLKPIQALLSDSLTLAYLPHHDGITLRITASGSTEQEVLSQINLLKTAIYAHASEYIFSDDQTILAEVVGNLLKEKNLSVGLAESCTGGGVSYEFTKTPGCSDYFLGGIVAYSNHIKEQILGVKSETLKQFGAVSAQTALEMAINVKKVLGSKIGLSITGIAGPGGGTAEKPVGLIWFGVSTPEQSFAFKVMLMKDRDLNRSRSVMICLDALRRTLIGLNELPYAAEKVYS